jgi:hydroxylamine dehydrogenase
MTLNTKRIVIGVLGAAFLASLIFVQWMEVIRKKQEAGLAPPNIHIPAASKDCVDCHRKSNPGIAQQWEGSTHAVKGVGCVDCHKAEEDEADAFKHYGVTIATVVTPRDCARCHTEEAAEFAKSHHAKAGNILASLDNFLAETVEGSRVPFAPHGAAGDTKKAALVNGMASANTGCRQCHGSKVTLVGKDGKDINVDNLKPDANGKPTNKALLANVARDEEGRPKLLAASWPNTGIGRLNLDGSKGSCSACHSRHDFSPRRARRPENCGKCHLGPDHPQKEIYEESKHGAAYRDLKDEMNIDSPTWVLGKDYAQAPTCATCHMSGHSRNGGKITHDPGERISWTNRPPISLRMDTDKEHRVIKETDPAKRKALIHDSWEKKRQRMQDVCMHCHSKPYVNGFYSQYDDFLRLYNEKFGKAGLKLMKVLLENKLRTKANFDEEIEWTWFFLWHHEGRRARHGASMMAPDYAHWHGMYEVADRFYMSLIPQARELVHNARERGEMDAAKEVEDFITALLARPEHAWFEKQLLERNAKKDGAAKPTEAKPAAPKPAEAPH